jgi:hypothetical protein
VPNVSAYFGTAPDFWNVLLIAMVNLLPSTLLASRDFANKLAALSLPINRVVDALVGSSAGIRIDIKGEDNSIQRTAMWTGVYPLTYLSAQHSTRPDTQPSPQAFDLPPSHLRTLRPKPSSTA